MTKEQIQTLRRLARKLTFEVVVAEEALVKEKREHSFTTDDDKIGNALLKLNLFVREITTNAQPKDSR